MRGSNDLVSYARRKLRDEEEELGNVKLLQHKTPTFGKVFCAEGITLPFEARNH
jgi:hypothetical protein